MQYDYSNHSNQQENTGEQNFAPLVQRKSFSGGGGSVSVPLDPLEQIQSKSYKNGL